MRPFAPRRSREKYPYALLKWGWSSAYVQYSVLLSLRQLCISVQHPSNAEESLRLAYLLKRPSTRSDLVNPLLFHLELPALKGLPDFFGGGKKQCYIFTPSHSRNQTSMLIPLVGAAIHPPPFAQRRQFCVHPGFLPEVPPHA